jgi:nitronate monooxygenase
MGNPVNYADKIHFEGIKVISMVTNVEGAITLAKNGLDIIIAQGSEAGGHRSIFNNNKNDQDISLIGTISLVPQVIDSLRKEIKDKTIPVIAAGGISDGRGFFAALALGAGIRCCNRNQIFSMQRKWCFLRIQETTDCCKRI